MRIVIPGGSGQVGHILARYFHAQGHSVTVLSRRPQPVPWRVIQTGTELLSGIGWKHWREAMLALTWPGEV